MSVSAVSPVSATLVGAGISGLATALSLLRRGVQVTVLDRSTPGNESSWAGGGILAPLLPWQYSEALSNLALRSMATYQAWIEYIELGSGASTEFWRCGMRILDASGSEAARDWCAHHGLSARNPAPGEILLPEIAQVRNPRLIQALRLAVEQLGGTIHVHSPVGAVTAHHGRVVGVHAGGSDYSVDQLILATGAWAGLDIPGLPPAPHIRPIRGQMLLFKLEPGVLDTILYRQGLYLIPRRDGHILVGSTLEDAGFDKSTDAATLARLHREAAELLPVLVGVQPIRHWAGLRPGSPGNIPIIDRHPDFENVFINVGHYRYGVTLAPASAELLVDLMEGRTPALDPAPYRWSAALQRRWGDTL